MPGVAFNFAVLKCSTLQGHELIMIAGDWLGGLNSCLKHWVPLQIEGTLKYGIYKLMIMYWLPMQITALMYSMPLHRTSLMY
jgi:hypothetical protein